MVKVKKVFCLILCFLIVLSPFGCSKSSNIFTFDISADPQNLDPQYATSASSQSIICNSFEGLMKLDDTGKPVLAAAEDYTVSENGTEYIFHLKKDAVWSNGEPVTAKDFKYALTRLFTTGSASANAASFICIKNAGTILEGKMSPSDLGVTAVDDYTLKIDLAYANPYFAELISSPAAMPCNEAFFLSTKGKYGLTASTLIYNGAYVVNSWDKNQIVLKRNGNYKGASGEVDSAIFHILSDGEDPVTRFTSKTTDAVILDTAQQRQLQNKGYNISGSQNTVWALVYNTKGIFGNANLRRALSDCINFDALSIADGSGFSLAEGYVTPSILIDQNSYRSLCGPVQLAYNPEMSRGQLSAAMAELGIRKLPTITLLVPDFNGVLDMSSLIQTWQKELNVFINVSVIDENEIMTAVRSGNFDAALVPYGADYNSPKSILENFATGASQNYCQYSNSQYDSLLSAADAAETSEQIVGTYRSLENMLLDDCASVPFLYETKYLAYNSKISGLYASASFDRIYLDKLKKS